MITGDGVGERILKGKAEGSGGKECNIFHPI